MIRLYVSQLAWQDLRDVTLHYVHEGGLRLAERLIDSVRDAFLLLQRLPHIGPLRQGRSRAGPPLRTWKLTRFPHLLFYAVEPVWIEICRVLHEVRDLANVLNRA